MANKRRRCLRCGSDSNITRDHVVSRMLLKQAMGGSLDKYQAWSTEARDKNIQPLCRDCNGEKGGEAVDYRTMEEHITLLNLLDKYGLDIEVKFEPPYDGVRTRIRWCQFHGNTDHRTDECPLFLDMAKLIDHVERHVEETAIVERAMRARRTKRSR